MSIDWCIKVEVGLPANHECEICLVFNRFIYDSVYSFYENFALTFHIVMKFNFCFADLRKIFPFELFHLGGDEVNTSQFEFYYLIQSILQLFNWQNYLTLFQYFTACWEDTPHVNKWYSLLLVIFVIFPLLCYQVKLQLVLQK